MDIVTILKIAGASLTIAGAVTSGTGSIIDTVNKSKSSNETQTTNTED